MKNKHTKLEIEYFKKYGKYPTACETEQYLRWRDKNVRIKDED